MDEQDLSRNMGDEGGEAPKVDHQAGLVKEENLPLDLPEENLPLDLPEDDDPLDLPVSLLLQQPKTEEKEELISASQPSTIAATSHVNGQGLWRSWQRSFRRPLDAMLDLIDNAVDANHGHGRIRISLTSPNVDDQGILMVNSYHRNAHKEMSKILEVFSSQKEQEAIGENGVGVKQASASLSDFSVVVTKKGACFQVGFLVACLQRSEGIHIPSFTLKDDLEAEVDRLCEDDSVFSECMQFLGGRAAVAGGDIYGDEDKVAFRDSGRNRLLELMFHMYDSTDWKDHECVFALLLDQMRIKRSGDSVDLVLFELKERLPHTYLHLQAQKCDITILNEPLCFQYWERRLVELTYFPINISPDVSFLTEKSDEVASPLKFNQLRVFVGFDPLRSTNEEQTSCASFYIYSRECGRLVRHLPDCRNELGLPAGGTAFCQGLTVILDDCESSLPLTPTKQDIAWSDGTHGDIHRSNVYAWVRAVINVYYNYFLSRFETKTKLSGVLRNQVSSVESLLEATEPISPIGNAELFNSFTGLHWIRHGTGRIVVKNKNMLDVEFGDASLLRFPAFKPVIKVLATVPKKVEEPTQSKKPRSAGKKVKNLHTPPKNDDSELKPAKKKARLSRPSPKPAKKALASKTPKMNPVFKRAARKGKLASPPSPPEDDSLEMIISTEDALYQSSSGLSHRNVSPKSLSDTAPRDSLVEYEDQEKTGSNPARKRMCANKQRLVDQQRLVDPIVSESVFNNFGTSKRRRTSAKKHTSGKVMHSDSSASERVVDDSAESTDEFEQDDEFVGGKSGTPRKKNASSRIRASKQRLADSSFSESLFEVPGEDNIHGTDEDEVEPTGVPVSRKPVSRIRASKQKLMNSSFIESVLDNTAKGTDRVELDEQLVKKEMKIAELEQSNQLFKNELEKLKETSNAELEKLQRRIQLLEAENKVMKDELDRKNGQLMALDEIMV